MHNNTLEKYKKAIKIKYEIEKGGEYFDYLHKPSRGKLRDFCWLIFENNPTQDDLNVFRNLFSLDFDHTKKNKFKEKKDKFRPIETFFKGETDPANIDAINLAAIMVDFQPRPFKKFHEKCKTEKAKPIKSLDKANAAAKIEKAIIARERFARNENEESGNHLKQGNLFLHFKNIFSKKIEEKIYSRKVMTI
jgi:hypothetical protein